MRQATQMENFDWPTHLQPNWKTMKTNPTKNKFGKNKKEKPETNPN